MNEKIIKKLEKITARTKTFERKQQTFYSLSEKQRVSFKGEYEQAASDLNNALVDYVTDLIEERLGGINKLAGAANEKPAKKTKPAKTKAEPKTDPEPSTDGIFGGDDD